MNQDTNNPTQDDLPALAAAEPSSRAETMVRTAFWVLLVVGLGLAYYFKH